MGDVGDLGDRVEGDLDEAESKGERGGPRGEETGEKTESSLGLLSILIVGKSLLLSDELDPRSRHDPL